MRNGGRGGVSAFGCHYVFTLLKRAVTRRRSFRKRFDSTPLAAAVSEALIRRRTGRKHKGRHNGRFFLSAHPLSVHRQLVSPHPPLSPHPRRNRRRRL